MEYEELKKIAKKEMEYLRKLCFKYKRKKFIEKDILIKIIDKKHNDGLYTEVNQMNDYIHMLLINEKVLEDKETLSETIKYLLIKAFCKEYFYAFHNSYDDKSYIFLAMLQFTGCKRKNKYYLNYEKSTLYRKIKEIDSFDKLQLILLFENGGIDKNILD